jgi:CRISPR-associated endonuclease/helicase Cas3
MVFSALVDADRLATEAFYAGGGTSDASGSRRSWHGIDEYLDPLERHLASLASQPDSPVNAIRRQVLDWCQAAAAGGQGAYTLTVPTGGGKTLASLAFALRHARKHRLRRVVVALPFISILDQTADVFRRIFEPVFGDHALVEHHSNLKSERTTVANAMASENWDAPLVITTQVQLFESLFSNRPRDCRKLHNLSRSVIVLDEVQTLPVGVLAPVLDQLQQLCSTYGSTVLLTTATQPALHDRPLGPAQFAGLQPAPTEVVPAGAMNQLFESLRRVTVEWPRHCAPTPWGTLATDLLNEHQALAIVHSRKDARTLWEACNSHSPGSAMHLSALMCPAHRRAALAKIDIRLKSGRPCRVVSTQLVEAGVDLDFPVVFRAMAGLESLAQAAGRCNREGRRPLGRFVVFRAESDPPPGLRQHAEIALAMLARRTDLDLLHPSTFREYFDRLYASTSRDAHGVQPLREALRFEATASAFRMIDDSGATVFIAFDLRAERAIEEVRLLGPSRDRFRALQQFGVSVAPWTLSELRAQGAIEVLHESVAVLNSSIHYHPELGLLAEPPGGTFLNA